MKISFLHLAGSIHRTFNKKKKKKSKLTQIFVLLTQKLKFYMTPQEYLREI
jgi:hypothetical protein